MFLNKSGKYEEDRNTKKNSQHWDNIDYLDKHSNIKNSINNNIQPYIDKFFKDFILYGKAYLNSGAVSVAVCKSINLPADSQHHSLVGSLLYEAFKKISPNSYGLCENTVLIASKGEQQHWVDYFIK